MKNYLLKSHQSYHDDIHRVVSNTIVPVNHGAIGTPEVGLSLSEVELHETFHKPLKFEPNEEINDPSKGKYTPY